MFFGEQAYRISKSPFVDRVSNGSDPNEICRTPLENYNYIGFDFQNSGYFTWSSEDWGRGAVSK